jgi:hypothetical protein
MTLDEMTVFSPGTNYKPNQSFMSPSLEWLYATIDSGKIVFFVKQAVYKFYG